MPLPIPEVWKKISDFDKVLCKFAKSFDNLYHSLETDFGGVGMASGEVQTGHCEALL